MDKYKNPPNVQEYIHRFMTLSNKEEKQKFIEDTFPGWFIASSDRYCVDYPHLQLNWEAMCKTHNVQPQKIVIVDEVHFDLKEAEHNHSLLMLICDILTKSGYVIRRKEELTGCEKCQHAMPTQALWCFLKEKSLPVPRVWSSTCSTCTL